jgi:2-polyprenyl-6-methoxyphenol hydroxylase-like FAD-dependent oxidoreductase
MGGAMASAGCCIVGGGPAGLMLGFLLARAGVRVTVLEKHADFLRDFRGDTIHPSTLDIVAELGLLEEFLQLPHQQVVRLTAEVYGERIALADFTHVPTRCRFIAMMPQWDFLSFIARHAQALPNFTLLQRHEVTALRRAGDRVIGVTAHTPAGLVNIDADLVVGTDGRHSTVRLDAQLPLVDFGAPIDVLWFRLAKDSNDRDQTAGYIWPGLFFVTIDRGDYWQCALVIPKGGGASIRDAGLPALRMRLAHRLPFLADNLESLVDMDQLKLLEVQVNRLSRWHSPGVLCIGDAAHAMSPVGGVGINLAVQDAVAAARILAAPLREGRPTGADLQAVQDRRMFPTRMTQRAQVLVQERVISPVVQATWDEARPMPRPPFVMRLIQRFPQLGRIPARLIGVGVRPEHIQG